jgi:hypothetical protein
MKLLVLTSEPITAEQLRDALPGGVDPADAEVMVVAPALQQSPIKFWFADADEAIAKAEEVRRESVEQLARAGVEATGRRGESDPMVALEDALNLFGGADRILLFTHGGDGQGYREDLDDASIEQRFGIPVTHASADQAD